MITCTWCNGDDGHTAATCPALRHRSVERQDVVHEPDDRDRLADQVVAWRAAYRGLRGWIVDQGMTLPPSMLAMDPDNDGGWSCGQGAIVPPIPPILGQAFA